MIYEDFILERINTVEEEIHRRLICPVEAYHNSNFEEKDILFIMIGTNRD